MVKFSNAFKAKSFQLVFELLHKSFSAFVFKQKSKIFNKLSFASDKNAFFMNFPRLGRGLHSILLVYDKEQKRKQRKENTVEKY
jgi:hypothetical protein